MHTAMINDEQAFTASLYKEIILSVKHFSGRLYLHKSKAGRTQQSICVPLKYSFFTQTWKRLSIEGLMKGIERTICHLVSDTFKVHSFIE